MATEAPPLAYWITREWLLWNNNSIPLAAFDFFNSATTNKVVGFFWGDYFKVAIIFATLIFLIRCLADIMDFFGKVIKTLQIL